MASFNPIRLSLVVLSATVMFSHAFVMRTSTPAAATTTSTTTLFSTSTDQSILSVELEKPLGVVLEEVQEGQAKGVYVLELAEGGSAAASEWSNQLVGLPLAKVMGTDVTNLDFDAVMDQLIAAPSPLSLDFIVESAASSTTTTTTQDETSSPPAAAEVDEFPIGTTVSIKVLDNKGDAETVIEGKVGENLRATLLENNIEVYKGMKQKLGNCGGGGQCTFCAADFVESEGWSERSDYEDQRLAKAPDARLTCLNNIQGPATIRLV